MHKVLIVEDQFEIRELLKKHLSKYYDVLGAVSSGEEAIKVVNDKKDNLPGIVVMDINLEGELDGIETAKQIQEEYKIAVLFLTSRRDDDALQRTRFIKPFGYIVKPVDLTHLKSNIDICIRMYEELIRRETASASLEQDNTAIDLESININVSEGGEQVLMEWQDKNRIEISNDSFLKQYWVMDNDQDV